MNTSEALKVAEAIADGAERGQAAAASAISSLGNTNALEIAGLAVGFAETIFAGVKLCTTESQAKTLNEMVGRIIMDAAVKGASA